MRFALWARLQRADRTVAAATLMLVAAGLVLTRSASHGASIDYHVVQARWFVLSLIVAVPVMLFPYPRILQHAGLLYLVGIVLLVLVKIAGPLINGSQRWLVIGGFRLQPSEPMKIFTILMIARMLRFGRPLERIRDCVGPLIVALAPMFLVFVEPDLGTSLLFAPVAVAALVATGVPLRKLALLTAAGALLLVLGAAMVLKPYQKERILSTFRHQELTPTQQVAEGYQLRQSLLAVGSGGVWGHGHRDGPRVQSGRLPHHHNDFIFAVLAEEHGMVGALALLSTLALLIFAIFHVGLRSRDPAGRLICVGTATLVGVQALVHIGVTLGLAPTTGMPLPFVSYGGSSLLTFMVAIALVLNVSVHRIAVPILAVDLDEDQ